jgi:hypothetical protein
MGRSKKHTAPAAPKTPLAAPTPSLKSPAALTSKWDAEAQQLHESLGTAAYATPFKAQGWLHVNSFVDTEVCHLLATPGPLAPTDKANVVSLVTELRKHELANDPLPSDDETAIVALRAISRAYRASLESSARLATAEFSRSLASADGQPAADGPVNRPQPEPPTVKWSSEVRDRHLANAAFARGDLELDDSELPLDSAMGAIYVAAASNPPQTVPYLTTKVGVRRRASRAQHAPSPAPMTLTPRAPCPCPAASDRRVRRRRAH